MCAHECVPMDVVNAVEEAHELGTQHHISCEISVALLGLMEHACVCPTAHRACQRPSTGPHGQQWLMLASNGFAGGLRHHGSCVRQKHHYTPKR